MRNNIVVIHVGIHKTGSSSIQDSLKLDANIITLNKVGINTIRCLPANHSEFIQSAFSDRPDLYHSNVNKGLDSSMIAAIIQSKKEQIATELSMVCNSTIIFSAEDACVLSVVGITKLQKFIYEVAGSDANIRVVAFCRDPIDYVESAVQQNVKGNRMTIDKSARLHVSKTADRYLTLWRNFTEVFSESNVHILSFDECIKSQYGIFSEFMNFIGVENLQLKEVKSNESICSDLVRLLSLLNGKEKFLARTDFEMLQNLQSSKRALLSTLQRKEVERLAANDVKFLKEKFSIELLKPKKMLTDTDPLMANFDDLFISQLDSVMQQLTDKAQQDIKEILLGRR